MNNYSYLNQDYDFLLYFDCLQTVKCQENSVDSLFAAIKSALTAEEFRDLFWMGIKQHWNETNDFHIISNLYKQFSKQNLFKTNQTTTNNNNNNITSNIRKTFDIQSIKCCIFSYLDLQSFTSCNRVNKEWLYDSYCPLSTHHLDFSSLFRYSYVPRNIERFKNISSLTIAISLALSDNVTATKEFVNALPKFNNLDTINFDASYCQPLIPIIFDLINNNGDNLNTLFLENVNFDHDTPFCFYIRSRLTCLNIENSSLLQSFWKNLASDKSDLSNLRDLTISHCELTKQREPTANIGNISNISNISESIDGCMRSIGRKMKNIRWMDESGSQGDSISSILIPYIRGENLIQLNVQLNPATILSICDKEIQCYFTALKEAKFKFCRFDDASIYGVTVTQGLRIIDRILRIISFPTGDDYNGINNDNINNNNNHSTDEMVTYDRVSNVELLILSNLKQLVNVPTVEVYKRMNIVRFDELEEVLVYWDFQDGYDVNQDAYGGVSKLGETITSQGIIYGLDCISHGMNTKIRQCASWIRWKWDLVDTDRNLLQSCLNQLSDHIAQRCLSDNQDWLEFTLTFVDSRDVMDLCVPYNFAVMVMNKLSMNGENDSCKLNECEKLKKKQFITPYYGGNDMYFTNRIQMHRGRIELDVVYDAFGDFTFVVVCHGNNKQ